MTARTGDDEADDGPRGSNMRTPVIAGNWKMNTTPRSAVELARGVVDGTVGLADVTTIVCPPFVSLQAVKSAVEGSGVKVAAQNVSAEPSGAFTGETSVEMLTGLATHVIVGHSERRSLYGEMDEFVAAKAVAVAAGGLKPIVCVGESLDVRRAGDAEQFCRAQIRNSLTGYSNWESLLVAYEPLWAIGTGQAAAPRDAQAIARAIRDELSGIAGQAYADQIPVLYGGSVNPENAGPFIDHPDIDGALVGGASLKADDFSAIVRVTAGLAVK